MSDKDVTLFGKNDSKILDTKILEIVTKKINELILESELEEYKLKLEKLNQLLTEIYSDYENYSIQFELMKIENTHLRNEAFLHVIAKHITDEVRENLKVPAPELEKRLTELNWIIANNDAIDRELSIRPFIRSRG